jgi:dipeptidyl aminopeptidase/acylaminoacyl peptidase
MAAELPYQIPSEALAKLVDQPKLPGARVSPDYRWACFLERKGLESIRDLAGPEMKLAGVRFNPLKYAPSRSSFTYDSITWHDLTNDDKTKIIGIPEGKIHVPTWAPDSGSLVFVLEQDDGLRLWYARPGEPEARQVSPRRINGILPGGFFRWTSSGLAVLTRLVVESDPPSLHSVPTGPSIRESSGEKAPLRTYQDLLKDDADADLFQHYATSQLARVALDGTVENLGDPAVTYTYRASPDRRYILRRRLTRPYSYLVPYSRFGGCHELLRWDGTADKTLHQFPATEELPKGFDSVPVGPREYDWRNDTPATLVWAETQDGGDMKVEADVHDRLYSWDAPFEDEPDILADLEMRYESVQWRDEALALVSEWRYSDRRIRTWVIQPGQLGTGRILMDDRSFNDKYNDPGTPLKVNGRLGTRILADAPGGGLLLAGRGATPEGLIPFLDLWTPEKKERLWHSEAPYYERVVGLLDRTGEKVLTLRESVDEPPNFYRRDLSSGEATALTTLAHPTPDFKDIKKELITYKREDGVDLSGTLYLPPDHNGKPLPVVLWAYPLEYKDPTVAGQVTTSPFEFNRVSYWGPLPFLAMGCAVLDDPKMPIIGEKEQLPNDTFRKQLVSSAQAAVNALVEKGIGDPERMAIGGHSYGAFMVANLLIHCDLFKTGIARSGAYNRTLTPFGFQGEERDFWESKDIYSGMSPFFHAENLDTPILFIHGAEDNNSGTYPMQSERMFSAIKGLGGQARLVLFPKESHAYRARESLLHMLWEQEEWLKKYLS